MDRVWGWLRDVPGLWQRIEVAQHPGQGGGERVSSSRPGSRLPAVTAALSMRVGSAQRMAQASFHRGADWTPDGADLPIPEWVQEWARAWRLRNGHHRPSLVDAHPAEAPGPLAAPPRPSIYNEAGELAPPEVIRARLRRWTAELAAWQAGRDLSAADGGRVALGLGAAREPVDREGYDPLDEQLQHRLGQRAQSFSVGANCGYLANWLDYAVDHPAQHPDHELEAFVCGLRDLVNAAKVVLGEPGLLSLGQCVEPFHDRDSDAEQPCGSRLFIDPDAKPRVAVCRRCRTEYPSDRWLWLAARQREWWPDKAPDRKTWEAAS